MTFDPAALKRLLPGLLADELGPVTVTGVERLKGGYSREMWAFVTAAATGDSQPWILCADSPDGVVGADSLDRGTEAALLRLVHRAGVRAPDTIATGRGNDGPFAVDWFVMQRLPGSAAVGPLLRDPWYATNRDRLGLEKAALLAAIHRIDPPTHVLGPLPDPAVIAPHELARWTDALDATPDARTSAIDAALAWLATHAPPPAANAVLVHGDFRTGNLLHDHTGITGVLDWEMAHLGDPAEDLAWAQLVIWQLGTGLVGALVDPRDWPAIYERAGGTTISPESLRFWTVLSSVKMSILAWRAYQGTPDGPERELLRRLFEDLGRELVDNLLD